MRWGTVTPKFADLYAVAFKMSTRARKLRFWGIYRPKLEVILSPFAIHNFSTPGNESVQKIMTQKIYF